MKKRYLLLSLIITSLTLSVFTRGTFAWFTDAVSFQKTYEIGDIRFLFSGSLLSTTSEEIVVPGQDLITSQSLYLTNQSKIDTNLRIQIHFSYVDQISGEVISEIYTGDITNNLNNFLLIELGNNWLFDENDDCFHYFHDDYFIIPASTDEEGFSFDLINSITLDGEKIDNSLSGATFYIQIIFQAKQMQFVNWQTIGVEEIEDLVLFS